MAAGYTIEDSAVEYLLERKELESLRYYIFYLLYKEN